MTPTTDSAAPAHPGLKVGDWVAIYHPTWEDRAPMSRPCRVASIGSDDRDAVEVSPIDPACRVMAVYHAVRRDEILRVFESMQQGLAYCTAAFVLWQTRQAQISRYIMEQDRDVLAAVLREPPKPTVPLDPLAGRDA